MNELCTIAYCLPEEQKAIYVQGNSKDLDLSNADDHFVIAPFLLPIKRGRMVEMVSINETQIEEFFQKNLSSLKLVPSKGHEKFSFDSQVELALNEIEKGVFEKVVLSQTITVALEGKNAFEIFKDLCITYPKAFVYLLHSEVLGTWMGASPELLLSLSGNIGETVSLAGTKNTSENSNWGQKENLEQEIVTDYIQKKLESCGATNIKVAQQETASIGPISHIKNQIEFGYTGSSRDLLMSLHPTPAVCGMPQLEAQDFIVNTEAHQRKLYTGFLGPYHSNKKTRLFVNLRCMQIIEDSAILYVGAGITKDSIPLKEKEETENKAKVLLSVIQKSRN